MTQKALTFEQRIARHKLAQAHQSRTEIARRIRNGREAQRRSA